MIEEHASKLSPPDSMQPTGMNEVARARRVWVFFDFAEGSFWGDGGERCVKKKALLIRESEI